MKRKVTRNQLLIIIAAMAVFMIGYSLVRYFTGAGFGEDIEKYMFDGIVIGCLGLFMYNRKLAKDEKQAKAAEEAERKAAEETEASPEEKDSTSEDENLPHWERRQGKE